MQPDLQYNNALSTKPSTIAFASICKSAEGGKGTLYTTRTRTHFVTLLI